MTSKITISVSDDLKRLITEYNERHPFEPLIISHLAQKAIFEKIKAEDPELLTIKSTRLPQVAHDVKELPAVEAREILLEEELSQPSKENAQSINVQKIKKPIKAKPAKVFECANCGRTFTAQRSTRKYCSGNCKTSYGRKSKKDRS